ncbi:MAG: DUF4249 domain-containing protein [Chitinophagaceae bacterium]|nr:DUF4249 domain-containing protein [Chitinophagaceae bacterium]
MKKAANISRLQYSIITLLFLFSVTCKEKYALPETLTAKNYLVVEGYINGGNDSTFIRLSRTVSSEDTTRIKNEGNAIVYIEGKGGNVFYLNEISVGTYAAGPLPLDQTQQYRLNISTSNGKSYLSDYVDIKQTPAIDSISWVRTSNGVQIYANTHDDQNNTKYYAWNYHETWEFYSAFYSNWEYTGSPDPDSVMIRRTNGDSLYRCWQSNISTEIIVGSTAKLSQDIMYLYPLIFIPEDSWKLEKRYSVLVKQRALSKGAYEYLENMKKNSEQLGSIFDPQPSTSTGNVHNVDDAQEIVLGYVYSSTSVEKRIFITRSQVPDWKYRFGCEEVSIKNDLDSLADAFGGNAYLPTSEEGNGRFISRYKGASEYCVDCRLRGMHERPDFW